MNQTTFLERLLTNELQQPQGLLDLRKRLRRGRDILCQLWTHLLGNENAEYETTEAYTRDNKAFSRHLDKWACLEALLRFTYPDFQGCVIGAEGCQDAPTWCGYCADTAKE